MHSTDKIVPLAEGLPTEGMNLREETFLNLQRNIAMVFYRSCISVKTLDNLLNALKTCDLSLTQVAHIFVLLVCEIPFDSPLERSVQREFRFPSE